MAAVVLFVVLLPLPFEQQKEIAMSDDQIKWVVTADDKDVIAAFKRMQKEIEATKQKQKESNEEARKGNEQFKRGAKETETAVAGIGKAVVSVGAGLFSATALMGGAVRMASDWQSEMQRIKQTTQEVGKELVKAVSTSNNIFAGAQIEKYVESIKGATKAQALQAFGGVSQGAPSIGLKQQLALTGEVAALAPTGQDLTSIGNTAAKLQEFFPGKSANDVVDLTVAARGKLGEDFGKVGGDEFFASVAKLKEAGMSPERALAIGMAGVEANLPSKAITGVAASLYESDPTAGKKGRLTADEKLKREFYKLNAEQRFQALGTDKATAETILGAGGALNMRAIGDAKAQEAYLSQAQTTNIAQQQLAGLGGFKAGQMALVDQQHALKMQPFELAQGEQLAQAERARKFVFEKTAEKSNWSQRYITGAGMATAEFGASITGANRANAVLGAASAGAGNDAASANRRGVITPEQRNEFWEREKQIQEKLIKALEANTAATAKNTPAAAKAKNIDAHVE